MKKTTLSGLLILMIATFTIAGCSNVGDSTNIQPTTATVTISTQGQLASGTFIGGIDIDVVLPAGVTVQSTPTGTNNVLVTNDGVVVATGVAAIPSTTTLATYAASTPTAPAQVMAQVINPNGFGTGEFVTINCTIAPGSYPQASDFSVTLVKAAYSFDGSTIQGLTVGYTAEIK